MLNTVQTTIQTVLDQLTPSSRTTIHFKQQAHAWRLTEQDALDAYYHGTEVKPNMLVRAYNSYEIGIYYLKDKRTGQPVITSIWKRDRR